MKAWKVIGAALCLLFAVGYGSASAQVAHLVMSSDTGDYIGQGQKYDITYTPSNSYFFSAGVGRTLADGEPALLSFIFGDGPSTPFASMEFGTDELGIPMQPGVYTNAQRAAFASLGHPGLDVSFDSRGSNTLTGSFTVTNFVYSPTLGIEDFAVSFVQHSEGAVPALHGTFTYAAVPEPGTVSLFALSFFAGLAMWVRRKVRRA